MSTRNDDLPRCWRDLKQKLPNDCVICLTFVPWPVVARRSLMKSSNRTDPRGMYVNPGVTPLIANVVLTVARELTVANID